LRFLRNYGIINAKKRRKEKLDKEENLKKVEK